MKLFTGPVAAVWRTDGRVASVDAEDSKEAERMVACLGVRGADEPGGRCQQGDEVSA